MKRRAFVIAIGAMAGLSPGLVLAQSRKTWKVGLLMSNSTDPHLWNALKGELAKLGYAEGRDITFVEANAEGNFARFPALAADLVRAGVDLIVAAGTPSLRAAKNSTTTIPIVIATAGDPVASGMVASFARPGGNITGMSNMAGDTSIKMFELARATLPKIARVAVLWNPANTSNTALPPSIRDAAARSGVAIRDFKAASVDEMDTALGTLTRERADALIVISDPFLVSQRDKTGAFGRAQRIPVFAPVRDFVDAGALMSYGTDYAAQFGRAAYFVDRILKGAKAGDLPIEQAATFELVVNKKTAAVLGLAIPMGVQLQATEVIE